MSIKGVGAGRGVGASGCQGAEGGVGVSGVHLSLTGSVGAEGPAEV